MMELEKVEEASDENLEREFHSLRRRAHMTARGCTLAEQMLAQADNHRRVVQNRLLDVTCELDSRYAAEAAKITLDEPPTQTVLQLEES